MMHGLIIGTFTVTFVSYLALLPKVSSSRRQTSVTIFSSVPYQRKMFFFQARAVVVARSVHTLQSLAEQLLMGKKLSLEKKWTSVQDCSGVHGCKELKMFQLNQKSDPLDPCLFI